MERHTRTPGALLPYILLFGALYTTLLVGLGALALFAGVNSPLIEIGILIATATVVVHRYVRKKGRYWRHQELLTFTLGAVLIKSVVAMGFMLLLPEVRFGAAVVVVTAIVALIHALVLYAYLRWPAKRLADKWLQGPEPQVSIPPA